MRAKARRGAWRQLVGVVSVVLLVLLAGSETSSASPADTVPPVAVIDSPVDGTSVSTEALRIAGTASDTGGSGLATVEIRVNGGSWYPAQGTSSWSIDVGIEFGTNAIEARAWDRAGNPSNVIAITVTFDPASLEVTVRTDHAVYPEGDPVSVAVTVANVGRATVQLNFPSSCQGGYRIEEPGGGIVSNGPVVLCATVVTYLVLAPGESRTYDLFSWDQTDSSGVQVPVPADYVVRGFLLDHDLAVWGTARIRLQPVSAPYASFNVTPDSAAVGETVTVDASASQNPYDVAESVLLRWDWEDDGIWDRDWSAIRVTSHRYSAVGRYTIRLEVWDGRPEGPTSQVTRPVWVQTRPVVAFSVAPRSGDAATIFRVDASSSVDAEDEPAALSVRWDWEGDGQWDTAWTLEKTAQHRFDAPGIYEIVAEIRDSGGLTASLASPVAVGPIVADSEPPQVLVGGTADFRPGEPVVVTAALWDEGGLGEARLYYRTAGTTYFAYVPMIPVDGGLYRAELPELDREGVIEFHIVATDASGNAMRTPTVGEFTVRVVSEPTPGFPWFPVGMIAVLFGVVGAAILILRRRKRRT